MLELLDDLHVVGTLLDTLLIVVVCCCNML